MNPQTHPRIYIHEVAVRDGFQIERDFIPTETKIALIDELMAHAMQARFVYSHPWQPRDMILWDNRAVLHRATPFATTAEKRLMVRTTIAGDGPTIATQAA